MRSLRCKIAAFIVLLPSTICIKAQTTPLAETYARGPIRLENTAGYGEKTDWTALFYNTFTDITAAPDGSIFAASSRQHKIFKFDSAGTLIKTFGQDGQGAGDINSPGELSILDGKYLVVGEYALRHRISLFDLEGKFVSLLKTELPVFDPVALRGGRVAYIGFRSRRRGGRSLRIENVRIKDIKTGIEKELCSAEFVMPSIKYRNGSFSFGENTTGTIHIARDYDGNLIVGNSMKPELEVYDVEGKKIGAIPLNIEPVPVTKKYINDYKKRQVENLRRESKPDGFWKDTLKVLKKTDISYFFGDYLPFYNSMLVDENGNILLFYPGVCLDECPGDARIYSRLGEFLGEMKIDPGDYKLIIDPRRKHLCFTANGLYALVQPKDSYDFLLRLIKVTYY